MRGVNDGYLGLEVGLVIRPQVLRHGVQDSSSISGCLNWNGDEDLGLLLDVVIDAISFLFRRCRPLII